MMTSREHLLLLSLAALAGCPSKNEETPPDTACRVRIASGDGADAVVSGSGTCAGDHRVTLRLATGSASSPSWSGAGLQVQGSWSSDGVIAHRTVSVRNPGTTDVVLAGLEWTVEFVSTRDHRMLHNGYQSWSYAGMESVPPSLNDVNGTVPHGGDNGDELGEIPGVSWWWTSVGDAQDQGIVLGADGATVFKEYVGVDRAQLRLVMGLTGESLVVPAGGTRVLDGLLVSLGDVKTGLGAYADGVAAAHPAAAARKPALGGWGSWNLYYADVNAEQVRQEMAWSAANLVGLGLDTVLLDDGYEAQWGDWDASPRFGGTLEALAMEQAAAGQSSALWLAPLLVDAASDLVTAHADWFVHRDGAVLFVTLPDGRRIALLDATNPQAVQHVTGRVAELAAMGFETFKIDFLFAGAVEGDRAQPVTSMEAYRLFMRALRDAAPGAHWVGCGAPMLPSVHLVDSMRTGPDIAYVASREPTYTFYAGQARQTAVRAVTDAWWSLDPDVVLLRGTHLSDEEAWTGVVSSAMAGGNWLLGDGRQAPAKRTRMALDPAILALTRDGRAARADSLSTESDGELYGSPLLDLMGLAAPPHAWRKSSVDGSTHWLAVFAWSTDGYEASVDLPAGAVELLPPSSDTGSVTTASAPPGGRFTVPRHGVRLFRW